MFDSRSDRRTDSLFEEATRVGHPDPEHATWGEVNVLSVGCLCAGRKPTPEEAEHILHVAEFDADFNS